MILEDLHSFLKSRKDSQTKFLSNPIHTHTDEETFRISFKLALYLSSPGDGAFLFVCDCFDVRELQEAFMEVVQVEDTHQQEAGGDKDSCEQSRDREPLQT